MVENEMVAWQRQFHGHEFEKTLGNSEGQDNLSCCNPWVAVSDTTERLNSTSQNELGTVTSASPLTETVEKWYNSILK